jgi:hypothetical protein
VAVNLNKKNLIISVNEFLDFISILVLECGFDGKLRLAGGL